MPVVILTSVRQVGKSTLLLWQKSAGNGDTGIGILCCNRLSIRIPGILATSSLAMPAAHLSLKDISHVSEFL